jgi:predicted DNA-binding protein (MmcQ/YjbR family)
MNKRHWNTVIVDGSIPPDEIHEMIDHSYDLVVKGLKKVDRERLEKLSQASLSPPKISTRSPSKKR